MDNQPYDMIKYQDRYKQKLSFDRMERGKIHPTDIDAVIEYKDRAWVLIEVKYNGKQVQENNGQRILMNRFFENMPHGKQVLCIICDHTIKDESQTVHLADCKVRQVKDIYTGEWRKPRREIMVGEAVDCFIRRIDAKN